MKAEIFKKTTNRRVYKNARIYSLKLSKCPICPPHGGCNRHYGTSHSWKDQSKKRTQHG